MYDPLTRKDRQLVAGLGMFHVEVSLWQYTDCLQNLITFRGGQRGGWACLSPCSSAWLPKYDSTLVIWAEQAEWAGWAVKQCKKICSSAIGIVLLPSLPAQHIQPRSLVCCQIWVTGQMSKVIELLPPIVQVCPIFHNPLPLLDIILPS